MIHQPLHGFLQRHQLVVLQLREGINDEIRGCVGGRSWKDVGDHGESVCAFGTSRRIKLEVLKIVIGAVCRERVANGIRLSVTVEQSAAYRIVDELEAAVSDVEDISSPCSLHD